jgi:prolyl-tRNA editing enzyme YbaK/EbsC (Cys-tRNA(Pro) deacylase)
VPGRQNGRRFARGHAPPGKESVLIPEKVRAVLDAHGLSALEFEPGSTPTAVSAAEQIGVQVGQIAKSILLKGKDDRFFMVIMAGDRKLKNSKLKSSLGVKTRMATAEETESVTGFRPGGVCPFGVEDVPIYVDEALAQYDTLYPAAGTDASGVPTSFDQLVAVAGATVADLSKSAEE